MFQAIARSLLVYTSFVQVSFLAPITGRRVSFSLLSADAFQINGWRMKNVQFNASRSRDTSSSGVKRRKKVKGKGTNTNTNGKRRASKKEIHDLVLGLGLKPVGTVVSNISKATDSKLSACNLSTDTQLQYSRNGHAVLRSVFSQQTLMAMRADLLEYASEKELEAWRQKVEVATKSRKIAESCASVKDCQTKLREAFPNQELQIPFLQYFNTWLDVPSVRSLTTSPHLSKMAQTLLDVPSVRLYQDSLFHKRSKDGPTPWHSDARMAPLDTSHMITFWIPLQGIPKPEQGGSGLWFVDKSHSDFALPFWNAQLIGEDDESINGEYERLDMRYGGERAMKHHMPMSVGDCTVHSGWTLHSANAGMKSEDLSQSLGEGHDRHALAVTYVDARAEVREDVTLTTHNSRGHDEDKKSFQNWVKDVNTREYFEHPLVPIVWPPQPQSD